MIAPENDDTALGWGLMTITFLLVFTGCCLYLYDQIGWAQFAWVIASGTAGAGVVLLIEGRRHR